MTSAAAKNLKTPQEGSTVSDGASTQAERIWFAARGAKLMGPFSTNELQEKIRRKEIGHWDYCWTQGFTGWRPIASLEAFDRRHRLQKLAAYPTVDAPFGQAQGLQIQRKQIHKTSGRPLSVVKKSGRGPLSIYEWGLAALLSLVSAYSAVNFVLEDVGQKYADRLQIIKTGATEQFGQSFDGAVSPEFWQPLASAPSLMDVEQLELPVRWYGVHVPQQWKFERFEFGTPFGGMYSYPKEIFGRLSVKDFSLINVLPLGNPEK